LIVGFIVMGPFSGVRLARVPAFLPMYLMAMFLIDLITATLLFAQFAISRSLANLVHNLPQEAPRAFAEAIIDVAEASAMVKHPAWAVLNGLWDRSGANVGPFIG
jgi:hypothetical protein